MKIYAKILKRMKIHAKILKRMKIHAKMSPRMKFLSEKDKKLKIWLGFPLRIWNVWVNGVDGITYSLKIALIINKALNKLKADSMTFSVDVTRKIRKCTVSW